MLDTILLSVFNMSITASLVILVVVFVRFFLKKTAKIFSYALWLVVLFRLLCPFSFESAIGLLPINAAPIPQDIVYQAQPRVDTGIQIIDSSINSILPVPPEITTSANPLQIWVFIGSHIWIYGVFIMLIYSIIQLVGVRRKLIGAVPLRDNIYLADHISSPFVIGLIKPKIYLPSSIAEGEQAFVIAHEQYHIKRFDHIVRILGFIALTIHWFNPLAWLAFVLSGRDMEMSCDEAVMKMMKTDIRTEYSRSLLRFAAGRRLIAATPLAFGEGDTKGRVRNVMGYKKPMLWVSAIAVIVVAGVILGCMSSHKTEPVPKEAEAVSVKKLWEGRTEYVGNSSAVGGLIYELSFPDNMEYKSFELQTKEQPYEIIVHFEGVDDALKSAAYSSGNTETALNIDLVQLEQNAKIMFALIGNVEKITFSVNKKQGEALSAQYMRSNYGEVFTETASYDGFQAVLDDIFGDGQAADIRSTFEQTPSNFIEGYVRSGKEVISMTYHELSDGTWKTDTHTYRHRLIITGRLSSASKDTTYTILSNIESISFEQAWKASGLSSDTADYFKVEDAVFVATK